jgi:hypothetical protein
MKELCMVATLLGNWNWITPRRQQTNQQGSKQYGLCDILHNFNPSKVKWRQLSAVTNKKNTKEHKTHAAAFLSRTKQITPSIT